MRGVELDDAPFLAKLINDADIQANLVAYSLIYPVSVEMEEKWIVQSSQKEDEAQMIIVRRKGKKPIGIISVTLMDRKNASAHVGLMLERDSWNQGFGTEAVSATAKFMFERLNFHRAWLRVDEENARAIRCYEKSGFSLEGVLRDDHVRNGSWKNSLIMSRLATESERRR